MVSKGLMSVVKEDVSIPEEVLEIIGDFKELIASKLPKDLPPTRDKCHMDNVVDKRWRLKFFNVADIYNMMQMKLFIRMRTRGRVLQRWRRLM
jgi:hypothetical protein